MAWSGEEEAEGGSRATFSSFAGSCKPARGADLSPGTSYLLFSVWLAQRGSQEAGEGENRFPLLTKAFAAQKPEHASGGSAPQRWLCQHS